MDKYSKEIRVTVKNREKFGPRNDQDTAKGKGKGVRGVSPDGAAAASSTGQGEGGSATEEAQVVQDTHALMLWRSSMQVSLIARLSTHLQTLSICLTLMTSAQVFRT